LLAQQLVQQLLLLLLLLLRPQMARHVAFLSRHGHRLYRLSWLASLSLAALLLRSRSLLDGILLLLLLLLLRWWLCFR